MIDYKCTDCYDTGNATTYLAEFNGRMVKHTTGYQLCEKCQTTIPRAELYEMIRIIQELIQRDYEEARQQCWMSSCGHVEEDARWYKQIAIDTHNQIGGIETRLGGGVTLDRSFIQDTAPEFD